MATSVYIELHTSSAFSFLRAASLPEVLIDRAATLGYPAVALLDRDGVSGAPRFHKAALAAGIRPLIGAELSIELPAESRKPKAESFSLPVLCASQEGWRNLCRLISRMKLRAEPRETRAGRYYTIERRIEGNVTHQWSKFLPGFSPVKIDSSTERGGSRAAR